MSLAHDYLVTPPSSSRDGAPPLRRHHSTPSWGLQTPTPQYYYASAVDMYREFSNCTDSPYPITPASDEEYRSQYVVDSPPQSTGSSPQSSGTITPEMLRSMPGAMPPSPLSTPPDVLCRGLSHSCAIPGCTFVSTDVENIRRHVMSYHSAQTPKTDPPLSLVMDDNGVASVSFIKREPFLQETFEKEDEIMYTTFDVQSTPTPYPMSSPYEMTRSNTMPVSTPTRTPVAGSRLYHPYAPMTPASYQNIRNTHTHSLSDPSMAASLALLPTQSYMSPPTPPSRGATPLSRSLSRSSRAPPSLPLVVSALDKSHVCEVCQKRFKRLEHLRRHNKTHTGERGFRCEVVGCGKWFSRSDNLMAHRRYFTR
jgi:Zinc finger, C2H2 type